MNPDGKREWENSRRIKGGKLRVIPKTGMIARHEKSV